MKTRNLSIGIIVPVCLVLVLGSCATNPARSHQSRSLYGMIYDGDNKPVYDAHIYVNRKHTATSDIHGHFVIPNMKLNTTYSVSVEKNKYETILLDVLYSDPSFVLYLRMFSADQLIGEAERALRERDWQQGELFLTRAQDAGGDAVAIGYLRGLNALFREHYGDALAILLELENKETNVPYLYLLIADIYQYYMDNRQRALVYLNKFLTLRYDPEIERRANALRDA